MAKRDIKPRMLDAARLLADGMSPPAVAKAVGVSTTTIYRWMDNDELMEEYRKFMRKHQIHAYAKSQAVLLNQLDSDAGNGFLAQNAAVNIQSKCAAVVMGEDKQEITVRLVGELPEVGMPDSSDDK